MANWWLTGGQLVANWWPTGGFAGVLLGFCWGFAGDQLGVNWIKPAKGFIDDKQFWVVHNGVNDLSFLLHTSAQFLHFLILVLSQIKAL